MRNGAVWIAYSLSFRGRERLFLSEERWQAEARRHYARLQLPARADDFLVPVLARMLVGIDSVDAAARSGDLRVDDELHLASLAADEDDPQVTRLRSQLDQRIGEAQLPEGAMRSGAHYEDPKRFAESRLQPT